MLQLLHAEPALIPSVRSHWETCPRKALHEQISINYSILHTASFSCISV